MTKTVEIKQANLSELLTEVSKGNEVVLADAAVPRAKLVPIAQTNGNTRVAALHAGAIWTSKDFDEPLPEDFWSS